MLMAGNALSNVMIGDGNELITNRKAGGKAVWWRCNKSCGC